MLMPAAPLHPEPLEVCWSTSLLVVDDDPAVKEIVCETADSVRWTSMTAATFAEAEQVLKEKEVSCIVCDVSIGEAGIGRFLRNLAAVGYTPPILIIGIGGDRALAEAADLGYHLGLNICYPIEKPLTSAKLAGRFERINKRLQDGIEGCCHRDCYWRRLAQAPD
jgi:DNA-binding NtrC family response regulator